MNFLIIQGGWKALGPLGSGGAQPGGLSFSGAPPSPPPGSSADSAVGARAQQGLLRPLRLASICLSEALEQPLARDSSLTRKANSPWSFQIVRCPWNLAAESKGLSAPAITPFSTTVPHVAEFHTVQSSRRRTRYAEEAALAESAPRLAGRGSPSTTPESRQLSGRLA